MNAAKKSERARLQHAVDCIEAVFDIAGDVGSRRLASAMLEPPDDMRGEDYAIRTAVMSLYGQMAEETTLMDARIGERLARAGVDMAELAGRDRNLAAHEADGADPAEVHAKIADGTLAETGRVFSEALAELVRDGAFFMPGQLEDEVVKAAGSSPAPGEYEAALKRRIEAAEKEVGRIRRRW